MPGPAQPGKGMAITALIASILGCTCIGILVAVPLAIIVLVRSRGGQNHGKGLAIAALVISLVSAIGLGLGGYQLYDYAKDFKSVDDLSAGTCITAKGLTDESASGVTEIRSVGCTAKHDGEVLSTSTLTADEAGAYGTHVARCRVHPLGDRGRQRRPARQPRSGHHRPHPGLEAHLGRQAACA